MSGFAITIQFHPGVRGEIPGAGEYQATALSQKHIATQTAQVSVGVIKSLYGPGAYQNIHPAPVGQGGHTHGTIPHIVIAENTGIHSYG
jgi:hypothetical protein